MKKEKTILFLLILTVFFSISFGWVMAESRSIFIGDLIEIKVTAQDITIDELRDKFKGFEIVDIKEETESFLVTLRSFEPGEKKVQIGNKEIKITIKSTLKEIKKIGIYEGDLSPKAAGVSIGWKYIFYILLSIFLLTGGIALWRILKRKKSASFGPYEHFMNQVNAILLSDEEYLVKLTRSFKEYLESKYSCLIRGKTSSEIISEIGPMNDLQTILPEVEHWLLESDQFKFSGIMAQEEKKKELLARLVELVRKIEDTKEGES